jgi:hypothetical protein
MLGNKKISSVSAGRRVRIASRSDAAIPLEVAPDLMNVTGLILNKQSFSDFSAEGSITVSKFLFRKKFPFSVRINP